ncbi:MAG: autotransporter assembly complex protein TamA, partial [Blastomonas fulva]
SQGYVRIQLDGSYYQPVSDRIVMAGRVRLGSTFGADRFDIAPSRRFYAGGGGSVRGFGFQRIGPRDGNDDPIGGNGLAEFSLEARVRFGDFGVVPFFDAGNVYANSVPDFSGLRYGAGIGVRYYSSFGPLRIDVATPLNRQTGDSRIGVYISLGQAF